mmetsp:Transcript_5036/g.14305  ORF Transcript_5036/g.14305 Transcript_5036/m.14305 type:complete len:204 (+) Transcript_5036:2700-3311(+)
MPSMRVGRPESKDGRRTAGFRGLSSSSFSSATKERLGSNKDEAGDRIKATLEESDFFRERRRRPGTASPAERDRLGSKGPGKSPDSNALPLADLVSGTGSLFLSASSSARTDMAASDEPVFSAIRLIKATPSDTDRIRLLRRSRLISARDWPVVGRSALLVWTNLASAFIFSDSSEWFELRSTLTSRWYLGGGFNESIANIGA